MSTASQQRFVRIVWPLAIAQTLLWASFYYLFPALMGTWESDLGWSKTELSAGMTLALLVSALLAPVAGREIDKGHGHTLFGGAALLGAMLLVVMSQVTALWQFYVVCLGLGVAMAGSLYEPCFAIIMRTMGKDARQAITLVTLIAGFAGTIAFPTAHGLIDVIGWRGVVLIFAAMVLFIAVPLNIFAVLRAEKTNPAPPEPAAENTGKALGDTPMMPFYLLAVVFAMVGFNHGALIAHLLPILAEQRVHADVAVLAAAMIGPMQVLGRLAMMTFERQVSAAAVAAISMVLLVGASFALIVAGAAPMMLVLFVMMQGAGYGVTSILRPVLVADLLGRRRFGIIAGLLAIPFLTAYALAPTIAGLVWTVGGYDVVVLMCAASAAIGLIAMVMASRVTRVQS